MSKPRFDAKRLVRVIRFLPVCPECGHAGDEFASAEEANADLDAHIEQVHRGGGA